MHAQFLNHVQLCVTPWIVAYHSLLSVGFPSQEYWSGLLFPSPVLNWSRYQTHVSCTDGQTLYCWATREAPSNCLKLMVIEKYTPNFLGEKL